MHRLAALHTVSLSHTRGYQEKIMDIRFYTWTASRIIRHYIIDIGYIGQVFTRRYGIVVS